MIDDISPAGSWQDALRYTVTIKVSEYPSEVPTLPLAGDYGTAVAHPFAVPVLSLSFHEQGNTYVSA